MSGRFLKSLVRYTKPVRYEIDRITFMISADQQAVAALRGICVGRPMLVVGNGPSLNKTPLDEFAGVTAIGMNKIDLLFDRVKWRPDLIVCMNNLVIRQHWKTFMASEIPVFLSWKGRWMISREHRSAVNYYLTRPSPEFSRDITSGIGAAGTVTYAALQFAYYMGADPVILVGVDHSFAFEGEPASIAKRKGQDVNHFDPNYFKEGQWWGLPNLELSELGYQNAKAAFEADGRRVLDATIGGQLTIFSKISIEQALRECKID